MDPSTFVRALFMLKSLITVLAWTLIELERVFTASRYKMSLSTVTANFSHWPRISWTRIPSGDSLGVHSTLTPIGQLTSVRPRPFVGS